MVGEGRPTTSFLAMISRAVDGGSSPAVAGKAKPENQRYRPLVLVLQVKHESYLHRRGEAVDGRPSPAMTM
jgi:hypothetical protein